MGFNQKKGIFSLYGLGIGCLSLLGTSSIGHILKADISTLVLSNSILSVFCFVFLCKFLADAIGIRAKCYERICTAGCGLCFAICMVWGVQWYRSETVSYLGLSTLLDIAVLTVLFAICLQWGIRQLGAAASLPLPKRLKRFHQRLAGRNGMLLSWVIIFTIWLPVFLATFPGIYHYDAPAQLASYYVDGIIEQPPLHTFFLVGCIEIGQTLFHSVSSGFAISTLIQMLILSASAGYAVHWIAKGDNPQWCAMLALLVFSLVTIYPLSAVGSSKDFLFGAFFLQFFLLVLDLQSNPAEFLHCKKNWLRFIVFALLTMGFRMTGSYIYILWGVVAAIVLHHFWKRVITLVLIPVMLNSLVLGLVFSALGVVSRPSRVAFGVPLQMLAASVVKESTSIAPEDLDIVYEILPQEVIESQFVSGYADPMLDYLQTDIYQDNPSRYLKTWVRIGKQAPQAYLDELVAMTVGWWYPDMNMPNLRNGIRYIPYTTTADSAVDIQRSSMLPALSPFLQTFANAATVQRIPVISMLFSNGGLLWLTLAYTLLVFLRKAWRGLPGLTFLFALIGSLLLSPVVTQRYIFPLLMCMPLLHTLLIKECGKYCKRGERHENSGNCTGI